MVGHWPSSFLHVYGPRHRLGPQTHKKRMRPISSHRDQKSLVNKGFWGNFSCQTQRVVLSGQDSSILPTPVANHSTQFGSSFPLTELAIK